VKFGPEFGKVGQSQKNSGSLEAFCLKTLAPIRRLFAALALFVAGMATCASASSATLLLEEPYGHMGWFTATGHAAVYLSGVCAETPLKLRRCQPGETGVVLSRYDGVAGYDWVAIPLLPYLYAVDRTEDIPLFTDAKMTYFLRDRYRREHLESIVPDLPNGNAPGGNWYELTGSSYDRTIYGFEIETTSKQDDALIAYYNAVPNVSHFHLATNNCADFAKRLINFYYPKALHRSIVADVGISTPKQMAKRLLKFSEQHPELKFSQVIYPQIEGTMPRSTAAHGVVESFLKSKKYIVPSAIASPIFAGCVAAVYVGTGGVGRFDPARDALVFKPGSAGDLPLTREERSNYQKKFEQLVARADETSGSHAEHNWRHLQSHSTAGVDEKGRPMFWVQVNDELVGVGAASSNLFNGTTPPELTQEMLEARLQAELHRKPAPHISEHAVAHDWRLLQQAINRSAPEVADRSTGQTLDSASYRTEVGSH
jgi:hypothetical protein